MMGGSPGQSQVSYRVEMAPPQPGQAMPALSELEEGKLCSPANKCASIALSEPRQTLLSHSLEAFSGIPLNQCIQTPHDLDMKAQKRLKTAYISS